MPYLNLDKEQYESLYKWINVFYQFRDTGFANPNNDMRTDMREIYADVFHSHLDTNCPVCLTRGFNQLFDKIEQYRALHKPLELSENASEND